MNQKSKWLLTIGAVATPALVIAPVALIASCATTVSPAQAFAEALDDQGVVKFAENKGSYTKAQLDKFAAPDTKNTFLQELDINVPNVDKNQFELAIDSFTPDVEGTDASKHNVKFVISVKNKNDNNEPIAKSAEISLPVTLKTDSASGRF